MENKTTTPKEICGCVHLHTKFSDGGCDYNTLIKAAASAGLDYICVTDHMNLAGKDAGFEGRHSGVFVLVGYEHNDERQRNHYLAFGVPQTAEGATDPQDYINRVREMGGTGFLAHPAEKRVSTLDVLFNRVIGFLAHPPEKRCYFKTKPPYNWTRWDAEGFDGIEIWNQVSDWMEHLQGLRSFPRLFFPNRFIGDAPRELLDRWDEMNRARFVSAIGGVDAHSLKFLCGGITIYPIKMELRGVRTHLFIDEADWSGDGTAAKTLIDAMKDGKGFISNFSRGDARGSKIFLRDESGAVEYPGRPVNDLSLPATINIELTQDAEIKLLRNGAAIQSTFGNAAAWPVTESGVYRIEARKRSGAWIYSNPFPVGQYPL
ncbi:MAG: PHP domain-containing protein [Chitinispirillales bacterium]|jgi:hypothetical protein|nr:PHP domain-containing protein [Chitinispirillales bacterium]